MRGGEKCLEALCELYPKADIYTLIHEKGKVSAEIERHPIHTSPLQSVPGIFKFYRYFLSFFNSAIRSFKPKPYDLIISMNHCVSKNIRTLPGTRHICYCFTPVRYAWEFYGEYFGGKKGLKAFFIRRTLDNIRKNDVKNESVTEFVAISEHVRKRIQKYYSREASVIYPPVDTDFYLPGSEGRQGFYLIVSALVPYKKLDLAIQAFNHLGYRLKIVGSGPEKELLQKLSKPNIEFLGWQTDEAIRSFYRSAKALIFPGEEDFGIVPVEAQACGCPVIAYREGGALETVIDGKTGIFFDKPSVASLIAALERFGELHFDPAVLRNNALRFDKKIYQKNFQELIGQVYAAA